MWVESRSRPATDIRSASLRQVFADSYGSSGSERSSRPENATDEAGILRRAIAPAIAVATILAAIVLVVNTAITGIQLAGIRIGPVIGVASDPNYVPAGAPPGQNGADPHETSAPLSRPAAPPGGIVRTPRPNA